MNSEFFDKGSYTWDLDTQLLTCIQLYEEDRKKFWDEDSDMQSGKLPKLIYEQAERFTITTLKNTDVLFPKQQLDEDLRCIHYEIQKKVEFTENLRCMVKDCLNSKKIAKKEHEQLLKQIPKWPDYARFEDGPLKLTWERLTITLAMDAVEKIEEGANRILKLYMFLLDTVPSEATQAFLSRLSRCYVWGFDPECVILCRSVIEAAFRDAVDDEICKKHFGDNSRYSFKLIDRIQAAFKEGVIDEDIKSKANTIRERGNKAIHYQPGITKNVWETVCNTLEVLERLNKNS